MASVYNYVKFVRGTPAAWAKLTTKNMDTLYFIAETGSSEGDLYLGNILISSGGFPAEVYNITDFVDVNITEPINQNSLLVYNSITKQWENKTLNSTVQSFLAQMTGATAETDGEAGFVPQPKKGDENKFLRGDGEWVAISFSPEQITTILNKLIAIENALTWDSF